jgi:hypothetical protein
VLVETFSTGRERRVRRCATRRALLASLALVLTAVSASAASAPASDSRGAALALPRAIVFRDGFEAGDHSRWTWGAQCANTGLSSTSTVVRGRLTVQSAVVGQGRYGARFDLPAASVAQACETLSRRRPSPGSVDYYGLMVRFPADWREPSPAGWGLVIAQLNFQDIWGAPLSLRAHGRQLDLTLQSGLCRSVETTEPGCAYTSSVNVPRLVALPAPMALEAWHQLIVAVRWAADASGAVRVWHRLEGERRWERSAQLAGYPTLQWTAELPRDALAQALSSDKIGAYRGHAAFPVTIWLDGFVRARSFRAAAAALARAR